MTEIRLRPGASLDATAKELDSQADKALSVSSEFHGSHPYDYLTEYLGWVDRAYKMLGKHLQRPQVEQVLHTRHFWTLRQMDGS